MNSPKHIVILTGAGISAESGLRTFRDGDGLWKEYRMQDLATPQAWRSNPQLVLDFYNWRRKQLYEVEPNPGHFALVELESNYQVTIITQNVDDLHERAGSANIIHLHGELKKVRSTKKQDLVYELNGWELNLGDLAEDGAQLRPHIVWFGEDVPEFYRASKIVKEADIFIVVGTSLQVYPAASLLYNIHPTVRKYLIDPAAEPVLSVPNLEIMRKRASIGVPELVNRLLF